MGELMAFRCTITQTYECVILAASEDDARIAVKEAAIDTIDCAGGEVDIVVSDADREDVEAAELNEVLFKTDGTSASADDVAFDDDDDATLWDDPAPPAEGGE